MTSRQYDPSWEESWKTSGMREAEAKMEAAREKADAALAGARKLRIPETPPLSDSDLRKIEEAAKKPNAPREMRELQRRIDEGELTWRDIADGKHMDDPEVRAAAEANIAKMRQVYNKFEAGYTLDEVLDSERPAGSQRRWTR